MEEVIRQWSLVIALLIDAAGVLLIGYAVFMAVVGIIVSGVEAQSHHARLTMVRLVLGRRMTLALEFLIGSDIIRTAVTPTWAGLGQLGAIVALRIIITYTLDQDLDRANRTPASDANSDQV